MDIEFFEKNKNQMTTFIDRHSLCELIKPRKLVKTFKSKSLDCLNEFSKNENSNEQEKYPGHMRKEPISSDRKKNTNFIIKSGNESEIERLTDVSDDGNEERNNDKEVELDNLLFPGYAPVAFRYFRQESKPRIWCLKMITSPWFERVIMFIIILNCFTLSMYQPCENIGKKCTSKRCFILECLDLSIHVFFTVEMMVKIMAMGFYGKNTYLAETWNRLDFFIVIAG